ncbi:hypothetical protein BJY00DRAFT_53791 [Aspergillus carlsbadensis]|nr:hypothetical protein BJY00DRAFT_53791 [Aspergillus carlsbadensis]
MRPPMTHFLERKRCLLIGMYSAFECRMVLTANTDAALFASLSTRAICIARAKPDSSLAQTYSCRHESIGRLKQFRKMEEILKPTRTPDAVGAIQWISIVKPCPAVPESFVSSQVDLSPASTIVV